MSFRARFSLPFAILFTFVGNSFARVCLCSAARCYRCRGRFAGSATCDNAFVINSELKNSLRFKLLPHRTISLHWLARSALVEHCALNHWRNSSSIPSFLWNVFDARFSRFRTHEKHIFRCILPFVCSTLADACDNDWMPYLMRTAWTAATELMKCYH